MDGNSVKLTTGEEKKNYLQTTKMLMLHFVKYLLHEKVL